MPDRPRVPQVYGAEIVDENFIPVSMNNALVRGLQFPPTGGTGPTPHNTTLRFRYTFSNQIAERIDSRGVVFRYHYDAYGRIDVIQVGWYSDGTGWTLSPGYPPSMTLAYGAPADRVSRVEYEYDDANRVSWVRSKNEQEQLEGVGEPGSPGSPSPSPVSVTLASEYVWGLGDNGLDELLVKFDKLRKRWWIIQDGGGAGGDVVAIVDPGSGSTPIADVAGQWVYDAYGDVIVADHILAFPAMRIGHKGLFIDRLDVPVVESGGGESPRLVPFGHTISHNRNRLYSPQMGRFYQLDPNATAMALLEASIYHGRGVGAITLALSMEKMYGDGLNLYEYVRSNPVMNSDPFGLFVGMLSAGCPGPSDMLSGVLESLVLQYAANMEWDLEWAMDWSLPDDANSRTDSTWIAIAMARGAYNAFEIGIPGTDISFNPLDMFATRAPGNSRFAKRLGANGVDVQSIRKVVVPNPKGGTVTILKYRPAKGREIVRYPREVVVHDIIVPVSNRPKERGDANEKFGKPRKYDWAKDRGEPHIWHHAHPPGRMQLVPEWVHTGLDRGHQGRATWR